MDADPDFDPSAAPDPVAAMKYAQDVARNAQRVCRYCQARQPARAHHCRHCNKCVHTFDHHCGLLNVCIGERNRCRFWWFLFFECAAIAYAIGVLNTGFVWRRTTSEWAGANVTALLALIALWIIQAMVFGLWVFHTWLAITNTTTFEVVTGASKLWYLYGTNPKECDLPYSRGLCGNLRMFCCKLDTWYLACRRSSWTPATWQYPGEIERNSEDICSNVWENRFVSILPPLHCDCNTLCMHAVQVL
jgi:ribosomal protein L40E